MAPQPIVVVLPAAEVALLPVPCDAVHAGANALVFVSSAMCTVCSLAALSIHARFGLAATGAVFAALAAVAVAICGLACAAIAVIRHDAAGDAHTRAREVLMVASAGLDATACAVLYAAARQYI